MEKDLEKFMEHIIIMNKELSKYEDDKGNLGIFATAGLLCSVAYNEFTDKEMDVARFNGTIDKDTKFNKILVERPRPKYDRTHKDEDRYILENTKQNVYQVWTVQNNVKISKSYNDKEDAEYVANEINNEVLDAMEVTNETK